MTDRELADGLVAVKALEDRARDLLRTGTPAERRHAEIVTRAALGLRRPLEQWIASRACRAAQQ